MSSAGPTDTQINQTKEDKIDVWIVTGMSGAGKSTTLRFLEDLGFEAVDNVPVTMIPFLCSAEPDETPVPRRLAIGVDARNRNFTSEGVIQVIDSLYACHTIALKLLFLDADDAVLLRRFSETRRRHPLAQDRPAEDGIAHERNLLRELKLHANALIDTSDFKPQDLQNTLQEMAGRTQQTTFCATSFSFARGVPRDADLVFDVRFLKNPHYDARLKPETGLNKAVGAYIETDPDFEPFLANLKQLLEPLLPRYMQEGKSYLTIAFGCTGGKHRSVYVTEKIGEWLESLGYSVIRRHRDIPLDA